MSNLPPISFEPVDFTPTMEKYSGQGAFRFWCQTVLPLVYDDSLSYYELLNKVVVYLNNTISDVATAEGNIDNLNTSFGLLQQEYNLKAFETINRVNTLLSEFTYLKNYVDNYFDTLDTQAEIEAILDNWVTTGEFNDILYPIVTPMVQPIVEENVPNAVTSWLSENVDPVGSAVVVDSTLTISGAAADAKVTGDKIAFNATAISAMLDAYDSFEIGFESGYIAANGAAGNDASRIRIKNGVKYMPQIKSGDIIVIKPPYAIYNIVAYNTPSHITSSFFGLIQRDDVSNIFIIPDNFDGKYIDFTIKDTTNTENADISDRIDVIGDYIRYCSPSDTAELNEKLISDLYNYNSVDVFKLSSSSSGTSHGLTFTKNSDGTWTIVGTADANTTRNIVNYSTQLPEFIVPGKKYRLSLNGGSVPLQFFFYINGSQQASTTYRNDADILIPNNTTGIIIRFNIPSGTVLDETINYTMIGNSVGKDDELSEIILNYNTYNVFELASSGNRTSGGITYQKNNDGSWTISGTATEDNFCNLVESPNVLPDFLVVGRQYRLELNNGTIPIQFIFYNNGAIIGESVIYTEDATITIPDNATGAIIRFRIFSGNSYNETVHYKLIALPIYGNGDGVLIETEYNYYNDYTFNVSPNITTDSNGWLQAIDTETQEEDNKTDMTAAIMAMLNSTGYCHLGEGIFYVSGNIDMPPHSTLCGCGEKSTIKLLSTVSNGYCVKLQDHCTIKDVNFKGSYSVIAPTTNGHRDAIHFEANYDGSGSGDASSTTTCMISNVWIRDFNGSGLYCHNTGISVSKGLIVTNLCVNRCYAGVNIDYYSEFNKFTNLVVLSCYYGVINNGGNNNFINCTFHATNTGFYINGSMPNSGHGVIDGCTFCHSGSNNGNAILFENVSNGFVISNCQIWFNALRFTNSKSVLVSGCEFGRGISNDGAVCASIYVSGGAGIIFTGCLFHQDVARPPKIEITNNTKTVFANCYGGESGNIITG